MTLTISEADAAWSDLIHRGQIEGYAIALCGVLDEAEHRAMEAMARRFLIDPHHTWTGAEVAALLRGER